MRFKQKTPLKIPKQSYRSYDPSALTDAHLAVQDEDMSVCKAAKLYSVPEQTLRDRVKGKISIDCISSGTAPILSQYEEAKIVKHIKIVANLGYGYTRQEVCDVATDYAVQLGKREPNKPLTLNWFRRFVKRWPELRVSKPRSLEVSRAKSTSAEVISSYFDGLQKVLNKHNLENKPHLIFNVDEKGITLNHTPPQVVAGADYHPNSVTSGKSVTTTILGCGSAIGTTIPPFYVFAGKRLMPELLKDAAPGAEASMSDSGWSNTDIFRKFLMEHFIKYIPHREPGQHLLLLLDGHKSHIAVDIIEWAKENNIVIFVLPAHTSHVLQPLDVACFGPFQKMYNSECHKLIRKNTCGITRYDVCSLTSKVYLKALSAENLQAAFRKTGIYPYNPSIISDHCVQPSEVYLSTSVNSVTVEENNIVTVETNERDKLPVSEIQINNVNDPEIVDEPDQSKSPSYFLCERIDSLKQSKSKLLQKKPRKCMGKIVSGKAVTESNIEKLIHDHQKSTTVKTTSTIKRKPVKSRPKPSAKKIKVCDSNKAGPSHVYVSDSESSDSERESQIDQSDKCCVCKLFYPKQVKESVSLLITKWVQCDNVLCNHWVHLNFCTSDSTAVRRATKFYCMHCHSMDSFSEE